MIKLITALLLLPILACGQATKKQEPVNLAADWEIFDQSGYSIQYPTSWELKQSREQGPSFFLFSPLESDKDRFKENINLIEQDLTGLNINLDKYTEISEEQIKNLVTNVAVIESKRVKTNQMEYHKIIYSGDQGTFHLQFEQFYWVINNRAFVLTLTCEKDKFEAFKETGEKILNSFRLK